MILKDSLFGCIASRQDSAYLMVKFVVKVLMLIVMLWVNGEKNDHIQEYFQFCIMANPQLLHENNGPFNSSRYKHVQDCIYLFIFIVIKLYKLKIVHC